MESLLREYLCTLSRGYHRARVRLLVTPTSNIFSRLGNSDAAIRRLVCNILFKEITARAFGTAERACWVSLPRFLPSTNQAEHKFDSLIEVHWVRWWFVAKSSMP